MAITFNHNDQVYVKDGKLGIGTDSPTSPLHIVSSTNRTITLDFTISSGGYTWASFKQSGTEKFRIWGSTSENYLSFYNDQLSEHQLTLASNGNVGIGTTSPTVPLTVVANSGGTAVRLLGRAGDGYAFTTFRNNADSATNGEIGISDAQNMLFYIGASERMRITSSGNVGIGTTAPGYKLQVNGDAAFFSAAGSLNSIITQGSEGKGRFYLYDGGNATIALQTNAPSYFNAGNVGIGTTSPSEKLDVDGNIYAQNRIINADVSLSNKNLLEQTTIKISNLNDIYANVTKTVISEYEARYVNDNTGATTIRGNAVPGLVDGQLYTLSVYYKDLIGTIDLDIGDTPLDGPYKSATGTSSVPTSGRIYGKAVRTNNAYEFIDINLSTGGSVTLLNPKLEEGSVVTEFIATSEKESIPQTITTNNLISTGNVGIGTTSPTNKLDVNHGNIGLYADAYASTGLLRLFGTDNAEKMQLGTFSDGAYIYTPANKYLSVYTGGSEKLRISSTGNVGIGTTSPTARLSLGTATSGYGITWNDYSNIFSEYSSADLYLANNFYGNIGASGYKVGATGNFGAAGIAISGTNGGLNGNIRFFADNAASKTLGDAFTPTEVMRITAAGNVGIGKTDPSAPLHINGGSTNQVVKIQSTTAPYVRFKEGGTDVGFIQFGTDSYISNQKAGTLNFRTNNTDKMTILSGGNVGIGTTAPDSKLTIEGSLSASSQGMENLLTLRRGFNSGIAFEAAAAISLGRNLGDLETRLDFVLDNANSGGFEYNNTVMTMLSGGNVGIGTTSPTHPLHVEGYIATNSSSNVSGLLVRKAGSTIGFVGQSGGWVGDTTDDLAFSGETGKNIRFYTNGSIAERMRITADGKLGIGTSIPASILHSAQSTGSVNELYITQQKTYGVGTGTAERAALVLGISESGIAFADRKFAVIETGTESEQSSANSFLAIKTRVGGGVNERMRITSGGNVGIGTATPGQLLHVNGGSLLVNSGTSATDYRDIMIGGIGGWSSNESHGIDTVYNTETSPITFSRIESHFDGTDGRIRFRNLFRDSNPRTDILMTVHGNGNVGIGTDSPTSKLHIAGFSTGAGLKMQYGNSVGTIEAVNFIANGGANGVIGMQMVSAGVGDLWLGGSGGRSLTLYRDGNVGIGTTAPAQKLEVAGITRLTDTNANPLELNRGLDVDNVGPAGVGMSFGTLKTGVYKTGAYVFGGLATNGEDGTFGIQTRVGDALTTKMSIASDGTIQFNTYGAGFLKTDTGGVVSVDTNTYLTAESDTLATVTARGATTSTQTTFSGDVFLTKSSGNNTLHINSAGGGTPVLYMTSPTRGWGQFVNGTDLWFKDETGNVVTMVLEAGGNVGIGTADPDKTLTVGGTNTTHGIDIKTKVGATVYKLWEAEQYFSDEGYQGIYYGNVKKIQFRANGDSYFNGGKVGIGTTSPETALQVVGDIGAGSGYNGGFYATADASNVDQNWGFDFSKTAGVDDYSVRTKFYPTANSARKVGFYDSSNNTWMAYFDGNVDSNPNFIISTGGNVGIGTNNPSYKLTVDSGTDDIGIVTASSDSGSYIGFIDNATSVVPKVGAVGNKLILDASQYVGVRRTDPSYALDVSGTIRATGDVIAYSDARVKENVETIPNALDKVKAMRGVGYNKIGEEKRSIGVIAQEMLEVMPEVVSQDEQGMYSVAYGNLVGVLIEAVKDLESKVEQLQNKIDGITK